jgi:hypothetical protein
VMPLPVELLRFFEQKPGTPSADRSVPADGRTPLAPPSGAAAAPGPDRIPTDGDEAGR